MAFIADRKARRTYDPDRGYELSREGGGSGGELRFRLVGPEDETSFTATFGVDPLTPAEIEKLGPQFDKIPIVWTVFWHLPEWRQVIREALRAYMFTHGAPLPNMRAFVRFGSKGSIFGD